MTGVRTHMPWFGWVGAILFGLAAITAAAEQTVTARGVIIGCVGLVALGVGFGLRRPATPTPPATSLPRE